jgi:uncharacterized membrane protein
MLPISTLILASGLSVLRVVFYAVAALFLLLVAVQAWRQDPAANPLAHGAAGLAFAAAGWLCGRVVRRLQP